MLENSLWQQYHPQKSIRETLAAIYSCDVVQIGDNESELYAILKRHLTKKEIRQFIMHEAGMSEAVIAKELKMDENVFDKAMQKTYSKIRSNKIQDSVRTVHANKNSISDNLK